MRIVHAPIRWRSCNRPHNNKSVWRFMDTCDEHGNASLISTTIEPGNDATKQRLTIEHCDRTCHAGVGAQFLRNAVTANFPGIPQKPAPAFEKSDGHRAAAFPVSPADRAFDVFFLPSTGGRATGGAEAGAARQSLH